MGREIPSMKVNNYASIFTKPIFKNQNGEWYRDVGYEDSLDIIRENFLSAGKSFVAIGYYLKHMKEKELYKEGGYANIWECAEKEFGLSQPAATNYMKMNDIYSVNGSTPILDEKYTGFNKSQLQEMLYLPAEVREEIKPEQTVSEIRQIGKEEKRLKEPSENEIREFYNRCVKDMDNEPRNTLKERLKKKYRNSGGGCDSFDYNGTARGVTINKADEITWAQLVKLINQYIPQTEDDSNEADVAEPLEEQQLPGQMNITDYPEVLPKEIVEPDYQDGCPPGITSCNRQEWGLKPEEQAAGKKECAACWKQWNENESVLKNKECKESEDLPKEEISVNLYQDEQLKIENQDTDAVGYETVKSIQASTGEVFHIGDIINIKQHNGGGCGGCTITKITDTGFCFTQDGIHDKSVQYINIAQIY